MNASDVQVVMAFAGSDMVVVQAAEVLGLNESTVRRRLSSIYKKSKLNPRRFRDLAILVSLIEGNGNDRVA